MESKIARHPTIFLQIFHQSTPTKGSNPLAERPDQSRIKTRPPLTVDRPLRVVSLPGGDQHVVGLRGKPALESFSRQTGIFAPDEAIVGLSLRLTTS